MAQASSSAAGAPLGQPFSNGLDTNQSSGSGSDMTQGLPARIPLDANVFGSPIHSPSYSHAQAYAGSVTPYGSSLAGANTYPSSLHYSPPKPTPAPVLEPPANKRRQPEDYPTPIKRRRGEEGDEGEDVEDAQVGPNGGPKHWTAVEKTKLFNWMLGQDDQWESLKAKMNTVFRDGSVQLFNGRKSFTALKSCFHRNLEVFKQIHAFESYLADSAVNPEDPSSGPPPAQFHSTLERQSYLERKLEAARAARVPIGNLNLKTIDHWHEMGWYALFKTRYHDDPKTGLPVAFHNASASIPLFHAPANMTMRHASQVSQQEIDPQLLGGDEEEDNSEMAQEQTGQAMNVHWHSDYVPNSSQLQPQLPRPMPTQSRQHPASQSSSGPLTPQRNTQQPHAPSMPNHSQPNHSSHSNSPTRVAPQPQPHYTIPAEGYPDPQSQTLQVLARLTSVTQALLEACTTLTDTLRAQGGAGGSAREDGMDKKQKAELATEVLSSTGVDEEVRKAAAEYLKRLFHE